MCSFLFCVCVDLARTCAQTERVHSTDAHPHRTRARTPNTHVRFVRAHTHNIHTTIHTHHIYTLKGREATNERGACAPLLVGSFIVPCLCVSLSMIFQASRFSASGRRVPLEPRRSEACRSCQPMHVLSFGEGRSRSFWFPVRVRQPAFGKCEPASWWSLV